jgi:hypothetical protein
MYFMLQIVQERLSIILPPLTIKLKLVSALNALVLEYLVEGA